MASTLDDLSRRSPAASHPEVAAEAVRRILEVAREILSGRDLGAGRTRRRPNPVALERVARLRDELHVTANRVARFGVVAHPRVDPVRIKAPLAASAVLAPARLLHQLELSVIRLGNLLNGLTPDQWEQRGRVGEAWVSLGDLVDEVIGGALVDLLDLRVAQGSRRDAVAA